MLERERIHVRTVPAGNKPVAWNQQNCSRFLCETPSVKSCSAVLSPSGWPIALIDGPGQCSICGLIKSILLTLQASKTLSELEKAIAEAKKQCDEATAGECAAAWDTVEELSAAISHKKAQVRPVLRAPCQYKQKCMT